MKCIRKISLMLRNRLTLRWCPDEIFEFSPEEEFEDLKQIRRNGISKF